MMSIIRGMLPDDERTRKAFEIFADAGQWLRARTKDGALLWGVPSQASENVFYLTDAYGCSCPDFFYRGIGNNLPCKHMRAVRLHELGE